MINKYQFLTSLIILSFLSFMLGFFWENLSNLGQVQPVDYTAESTSRPQSLEVSSAIYMDDLPECGLTTTAPGSYCYRVEDFDPDTYIECDTDEDCYNKNGCGGYADPCIQQENR